MRRIVLDENGDDSSDEGGEEGDDDENSQPNTARPPDWARTPATARPSFPRAKT